MGTVPNAGGPEYQRLAYVFAKPRGGWVNMTETAKLTPSDGTVRDLFGRFVAISGDTVAVTGNPAGSGPNQAQSTSSQSRAAAGPT